MGSWFVEAALLRRQRQRQSGRSGTITPATRVRRLVALLILSPLFCLASSAWAQDSATIFGTVTDPSGAVVAGAKVSAKNMDTGIVRVALTDNMGRYRLLSLPVGLYELHVKQPGFPEAIRTGIHLAVGQEAHIDLALRLGEASTHITINEDAPPDSATTADISGLVGGREVKDLPLNGRSFDLLMTLNPGVVNFTWEKTGGLIGISNSTT